jgi:hypothetical protein
MFVTHQMGETRKFYDQLGCACTIALPHYVQYRLGDHPSAPEVAFMAEATVDDPDFQLAAFLGTGAVLSVPLTDVDRTHAALMDRGVKVGEARDRKWGWRSFVCRDPNGLLLDFYSPIQQGRPHEAS